MYKNTPVYVMYM